MAGFYRSSYKDSDGNTKYLAVSQMEPTDARRAFPCFDEPALKAEFTVTLVADKHHTCLSNMDQASEKEIDSKITGGKRKAVAFNRSPLMSTYLLAFLLGSLITSRPMSFAFPLEYLLLPIRILSMDDSRSSLRRRHYFSMRKPLTVNNLYRKWTWFLFPTSALEPWRIGA